MQNNSTAWNKQSSWYNKLVGDRGHYFHEHVIIPGVLRLLQLQTSSNLLDLGCGQGILAKKIPQNIKYTGLDLAESLISIAKNNDTNPKHRYIVADATKTLPFRSHDFTHVSAILSLQNIERADLAIKNVSESLNRDGKLVIVLNHPYFRIPRHSGWGIHQDNKIQYRYVNRYMSDLKIPINMHPGDKNSEITWSFHHSLQWYVKQLQLNGFLIESIEEWTSDKVSEGKASKMENLARLEIPLFMTILAVKGN
jgi:ubiquinone/menaquinone biosynthesis C-methylase UbiE